MGLGIFRRAFVVRRFGEENIVDGYGVSGYKDFIASLNVQPLNKDELQALPEGENTVKRMKAFGDLVFHKHWDDLKKNGCSDPAWPDGVNLNLVRNHIIYWYRLLRERTSQTVQLSMFDAGMDLRNERPLPPEVPDRYMVPTGKYPDRLNGKWDGLIFDPKI